MSNEPERLQILEMIEKGVISAEEGVRLLNSLQGEGGEDTPPLIASSAPASARTFTEPEVIEEPAVSEKKAAAAPF